MPLLQTVNNKINFKNCPLIEVNSQKTFSESLGVFWNGMKFGQVE